MVSLDVSLEHGEFLILKQGIRIKNLHHIINTDKAAFNKIYACTNFYPKEIFAYYTLCIVY